MSPNQRTVESTMEHLAPPATRWSSPDNGEVKGGGDAMQIAAPDLLIRIIRILDPDTYNPRDPESWLDSPHAVKASRIVRMVEPFLR